MVGRPGLRSAPRRGPPSEPGRIGARGGVLVGTLGAVVLRRTPTARAAPVALGVAVGAVAFGAADQYLGSRIALGAWAASVSGMSAPWLLLPFVAGMTQTERRRAALLGLAATLFALAGYFAMTLSPWEGVPLGRFPADLLALVHSNLRNLVGGFVTGPLFGLLGRRWRTRRSWTSLALLACAFCCEPLARLAAGQLSGPGIVWEAEVGLGAAMVVAGLACGGIRRVAARPDG